jgi:hypothetical protein
MRVFTILVLVVLACGGHASPSPSPPPASEPAMLSYDEMVALCERLHREAITCADELIDLNIELRMKYSPDFAEAMKDPAARKEAIQVGLTEVRSDATHAHERCSEYAKPDWGAAQPRSDLAVLDGCYAKPACADKIRCMRPVIEPRFKYRAERQSQQ